MNVGRKSQRKAERVLEARKGRHHAHAVKFGNGRRRAKQRLVLVFVDVSEAPVGWF